MSDHPHTAERRADLVGMVLERRYRIDAVIARGGMSTVYSGHDQRLDRPVAVKVMDPAFAADPQFVSRFEFEARSVAKLRDPGLVAVYDQGHDGDLAFLVMELVEGGTLRELLRERGPMPPHAVRAIAEPVLDALAAAHRAGLVHRDVKPENILISDAGEVKIADFGLVRAVAEARTTTGNVVLGTAAYLSPEQVTTGSADARSDVYAFGVLIFEMLTGAPPFVADTSISVAYQRIDNDVPAPSEFIGGVPPEFDELVARACARHPQQRFPDAGAMADRIRAIATDLELPDYRVPAPRRSATRVMPAVAPAPAPMPVGPADATMHMGAADPTMHMGPVGPNPTRVQTHIGFGDSAMLPQHGQWQPEQYGSPPQRRGVHRGALWLVGILLLAAALGVGGWLLATGDTVSVPSVEGMNQTQAMAAIRDAGFTAETRTAYSDTRPAGNVLGTDPPSGSRTSKGSTVAVLISGGRPRVPAIKPGADLESAREQIRAMGLTPVDGDEVYAAGVATGTVASVTPAAGTVVPVGSEVKIAVSKGKASGTMPDLRGQTVEEATETLRRVHVKVGAVTTPEGTAVRQGTVLSTDPPPGAGIGPGSTVTLIVSDTVQVPVVIGSSVRQATKRLQEAGFRVSVTHQLGSDSERSVVTGQDPGGGLAAGPGSTVNLVAFP
ncbi:MAG: Stk1 family PASTA domain-containing Ser/Thr kinase [Mycobacteriaceae bacterium]|nr:Stk1 family PASTA domain-containing Ser/Thr kinase [Mycobacteriaceae bacterium]